MKHFTAKAGVGRAGLVEISLPALNRSSQARFGAADLAVIMAVLAGLAGLVRFVFV
jgi:hypothetical protein